eukprot:477763_1
MAYNPRDVPIDSSIPPHEWTITQLNNKNKPARKVMCDNVGIEYSESDGSAVLLQFLLAHRLTAIKDNKNKILREKAKAKRDAANKQRKKGKTSKSSRNKPDSIRRRPAPLNAMSFNMDFSSFVVKEANKNKNENENENKNENENENKNENENENKNENEN